MQVGPVWTWIDKKGPTRKSAAEEDCCKENGTRERHERRRTYSSLGKGGLNRSKAMRVMTSACGWTEGERKETRRRNEALRLSELDALKGNSRRSHQECEKVVCSCSASSSVVLRRFLSASNRAAHEGEAAHEFDLPRGSEGGQRTNALDELFYQTPAWPNR